MYKEYREMSRCEAVEAMYQDLAARHRARFRSIHVRCHEPTDVPTSGERPRSNTNVDALNRSSASSSSRRPMMSSALTSSSSSPRTSLSLCLTASQRSARRRSSPPPARRLSPKLVVSFGKVVDAGELVWGLWAAPICALSMGNGGNVGPDDGFLGCSFGITACH